jgi:alcohol dehydrogenase class IV
MAYQFTLPRKTIIDDNALNDSQADFAALGQKAFVVTGKNVTKAGIVKKLTDCLDQWGIAYEVFSDITGEPTDKMIDAGLKAYRDAGCDFLIGIGGGSPLDSVKAIGMMSMLDGKISDYMGVEIKGYFPPMALIPTTSGTGSEATKFTVITDTEKNVKMLLKGEALLPSLAVIDPVFTVTTPKSITASTGMDALTHAVEAYTSRKSNTFTDMYALSAIKRIFTYLPLAYEDGANRKAREEMAIAAYEAGVCINNASVTLVHGMSRPIGALFHVAHGISNAMLISKCLAFALDGCPDRFARIAKAIGAADAKEDDEMASQKFLEALETLCKKLEIPTLKEYGIPKDQFDSLIPKMARDAIISGSPGNTIKEVKQEDIEAIYNGLW